MSGAFMRRYFAVFGCLAALLLGRLPSVHAEEPQAASPVSAEPRVWTDLSGRQTTAALLEARDDYAIFLKPSGARAQVAVERLSDDDRQFIRDFQRQAAASGSASKPADPSPLGGWLGVLGAVRKMDIGEQIASKLPTLPAAPKVEAAPVNLLYVRVSRKFLEHFVNREVNENGPVRDIILKTLFHGAARTTGRTQIQFSHSPHQATTDILFTGKSHAQTAGSKGPVKIHSQATTEFEARKRIVMDEYGVRGLPAVTTARTNSQTKKISTKLPGMRGQVARRVAADRIQQQTPAANEEIARHAEQYTNRDFDRKLALPLAELDAFIKSRLLKITRQLDPGLRVRCSTTPTELRIVMYRGDAADRPAAEPAPQTLAGDPPVAVWVHTSLVSRLLADSNLQQMLQPLVRSTTMRNKAISPGSTAAKPDFKFGRTDDGAWLTASLSTPSPTPPAKR